MKNRFIVCLSFLAGTVAAKMMKTIKPRLPGSFVQLYSVTVVLMMGILTACQEPELVKTEKLNSVTSQAARTQKEGALTRANKAPEFPNLSDFVPAITNPYLAFKVGKIFYYESETGEGLETNTVEITDDAKVIMGSIQATVVHDLVYLDGELIEETFDWYAQDKDGNVWYLGEDSKEYKNGEVISTAGSWEAGVQGAIPGLIMPANPSNGMKYRQEFLEGEAEDNAIVVNTDKTVTIGLGTFEGCLETMEYSTLEHGVRENKFYYPGTGLLVEVSHRTGEFNELVKVVN